MSKLNINNLNAEKNGLVWRKATHEGECAKCQKRAERQNKKCEIRELNDKNICEEHDKKKKIIVILVMVIFLGMIAVILCMSLSPTWTDPNAKKGHWEGKSQEQIEQDLNAQVHDGEMNVSIANTIKFPNGSKNDGEARIENIEVNHNDQKVSIRLVDSDETLYESGAIEPGYYIQNIKLNKHLNPGAYRAIATFTDYKHDTHDNTGRVTVQINLLIEEQ